MVKPDSNPAPRTSVPTLEMSVLAHIHTLRWLIVAIAFALYGVTKYRTYKRLASFNGPFGAGWSELWHTRAILSNRSHLAYNKVTDIYGTPSTSESSHTMRRQCVR
jgi:hypothetical protein